jgi:hypothetical protein
MTNLLTQAQVQTLALKVGWKPADAKIIAAIAMVESAYSTGGRSYADADKEGDQHLANVDWGYSIGLTQVRSKRDQLETGRSRDASRLHDPEFNLRSALEIFNAQGFKAWTTFNNGQYKAYLPKDFPVPVGVHVVISGDTLSKIAQTYGTFTWQQLASVNGLVYPYTIYIAQPLQLPVFYYTVQPGDTLTGIAEVHEDHRPGAGDLEQDLEPQPDLGQADPAGAASRDAVT